MHATHSILVNVPAAVEESGYTLSEMSKDDLIDCVVKYAEEMTDQFFGPVFDSQDLLEDGQDEDYPSPIVFSKDDWKTFADWLQMCENAQKQYASFLCNHIKKVAGTGDIGDLAKRCFLSHACDDDVATDQICEREFDPVRWHMKNLFNLVCGTYFFDSGFYDTYHGNAYVPYLSELKETAEDWALVAFDCHS